MANLRRWIPFRRGERVPVQRGGGAEPQSGGGAGSLAQMQNEMNRLFEQFFEDPWRDPFAGLNRLGQWFGDYSPIQFNPQVDVSDEGKQVKITAELPGLEADDVDIKLENNALLLRGEKKLEQSNEEEGHYRTERAYGYFQRWVPLPTEVNGDQAEADFKNGVLTVRLPKVEGKESGKRIEVKG